MPKALEYLGYTALVVVAILFFAAQTESNEDAAKGALRRAGYSEQAISTMRLELFAYCMKGRQGFVINTENNGRVKVCTGVWSKPVITVL